MNMFREDYLKIKNWIYRNSRPIDLARWQYHFENGIKDNVITALAAYQNPDGGFGHALEADSWNPNSSPIQTWNACELIFEINCPEDEPIIKGILSYLESGIDFDGEVWLAEIPTINNYPHAPWWSYNNNVKEEWGYNPTAALAGFILYYCDSKTLLYKKAEAIAKQAIKRYLSMNQLKDMHELACYSRLLSCIESRNLENLHDIVYFKAKLSQNIYDIIERDTERWRLSYCTKPSQFIDSPDSPFYQSNKEIMDAELDFILSSRNEEGVWNITWNWRDYEKEFAISENWWKANLVINYVKILMAFNRVDSEELFSKSNNRKKSMKGFVIEESTDKEEDIIKNELFQYNSAKAPFTQEPPFTSINRVVKDLNGDVIAGIISKMYCWNCLYITILWVKEECRNQGYGSILLAETEEIAKKKGSKLVHLDTFDFQAKDFYIKQGYEIFGVLDDCPEGHKRYFMKKNL